jgi:serine/threonine protein kinase
VVRIHAKPSLSNFSLTLQYTVQNVNFSFHIILYFILQDLFDYISEHSFLIESVARRFFIQILEAVEGCYQRGVLHRSVGEMVVYNRKMG